MVMTVTSTPTAQRAGSAAPLVQRPCEPQPEDHLQESEQEVTVSQLFSTRLGSPRDRERAIGSGERAQEDLNRCDDEEPRRGGGNPAW